MAIPSLLGSYIDETYQRVVQTNSLRNEFADGLGNPIPFLTNNTATGSYGSFFDTGSYFATSATTIYSMSLSTTDISNGVYISGSSNPYNTFIKFTNAGVYNIQFSAQFSNNDNTGQDVSIWLRKNDNSSVNDLADTNGIVTVPPRKGFTNGQIIASWNYFVTVAPNDYIQLLWHAPIANVITLETIATGSNPTHPRTPAVILTANRVDQFLSNTGSFTGSFTGSLLGTASYALTASYAMNGGGSGLSGGTNNYIPLWSGSNALTSSIIYQNNNKIGIGTTSPQTLLHISSGSGYMAFPYEIALIEKDKDTKFGVYTSTNTPASGAAAIVLGYTNYLTENGYFPGFEYQLIGQPVDDDNFIRYNFLQRDNSGVVVGAKVDLFNIYANGTVAINSPNADSKLGIGTSNPTSNVSVVKDGNGLTIGVTDGAVGFAINRDALTGTIFNSSFNAYQFTQQGNGFEFQEYSGSGTFIDRLTFSNGNFGIRTLTPQYSLDISGSANIEDKLQNGYNVLATGGNSHAEGDSTWASGESSHAEGQRVTASGDFSHAEGYHTLAYGAWSHTEGSNTITENDYAHAEGQYTRASGQSSHAEGDSTYAVGGASHTEGYFTTASGDYSHAEGDHTSANGTGAHAEGYYTVANGNYSHAQGDTTIADGPTSHAEGQNTFATGVASHAEGYSTHATDLYAHAEGYSTTAYGNSSHAEGSNAYAQGFYSHAEGQSTTTIGIASHAEGYGANAIGDYSHAEGASTLAIGEGSHAEGMSSLATGPNSHAEGNNNYAVGSYSHAEGNQSITGYRSEFIDSGTVETTVPGASSEIQVNGNLTAIFTPSSQMVLIYDDFSYNTLDTVFSSSFDGTYTTIYFTNIGSGEYIGFILSPGNSSGEFSHAEGGNTVAFGIASHAEGYYTHANTFYSHAEGINTYTDGNYSHAEGNATYTSGVASHAEGSQTQAAGSYSHAEGIRTEAAGEGSHAEGTATYAGGDYSHAEGSGSAARGAGSHAAGLGTIANGDYQSTIGQYNISNSNQSAFIIGNGTDDANRSNLLVASGTTVEITGSLALPTGIGIIDAYQDYTIPSGSGIYKISAGNPITLGMGSLVFPSLVEGASLTVINVGNYDATIASPNPITANGSNIGAITSKTIWNFYGIDGNWYGGRLNNT